MIMLNSFMILSNNPKVIAEQEKVYVVEGSLIDVMYKARDYIHAGHRLLTHPLDGSVKPNETPYKSIVISKAKSALDYESLTIIEGAIRVSEKMLSERPCLEWSQRVLADFQVIDSSLLESALVSLSIY